MSATAPAMTEERVTAAQLAWVSACLGLTLVVRITQLPVWVTATVIAVAAMRLTLAARGQDAPPRALRFVIAGLAIGLLFVQFRTFNGLAPGTALLSLIAGLKLLETRTRRDIHVIVMIVYFLSLATLLEGDSFWLLLYLIAVCWLTTATLLRLTSASRAHPWRTGLPYAGRLLLQALPVALAFWLFFPRFGGPLWSLPDDGGAASSGLSDVMSPGEISELAMSDEVAFRVRFSGATPPEQQRYWRGPVLHDFDGRTWRRTEAGPALAPALAFEGPAYQYTLSLEPSPHNWLFVLDWPSRWNAARAFLTSDYMLTLPNAVAQPLDVIATSYAQVSAAEPLRPAMRHRDTQPLIGNPRTLRFAQELRAAHPDDWGYLNAVLELFHRQPFFYTLTPPRLAADSVDGFLFDTRRGFCGHYASALAALMRAAGIPARVVTGYQGGTYNRFADYWIVRQSNAHAWDEVWIEGHGWLRVDPTTAIAPERIESRRSAEIAAEATLGNRWRHGTPWLADARLRLDALRLLWRERVLQFDSSSQDELLAWLHVPDPDGQKLALLLAACLIAGMAWLTWQVRRELKPRPTDPVNRAFERLCGRLSAIGLARTPAEGAEAYAERIAALRPDLAVTLRALCRRYSQLRYARNPSRTSAAAFIAAVRTFRPGRLKPGTLKPRARKLSE